jgi:hypothetical protein
MSRRGVLRLEGYLPFETSLTLRRLGQLWVKPVSAFIVTIFIDLPVSTTDRVTEDMRFERAILVRRALKVKRTGVRQIGLRFPLVRHAWRERYWVYSAITK